MKSLQNQWIAGICTVLDLQNRRRTYKVFYMNDFDDLDDLERRMRRKLLFDGPSNRGSKFSPEEQAIADKLLGKSESQRLQNRRDNSRPFKPKPQLVVAEYFETPPSEHIALGGGWTVVVRVNGVEHQSTSGLSYDECLQLILGLSRRGVQTKKIETEWMKHQAKLLAEAKARKPESSRKAILQRLKGFRK